MHDRDVLLQMCTHIAGSIYKGNTKANPKDVSDKAFTTSLMILNHIDNLEKAKSVE